MSSYFTFFVAPLSLFCLLLLKLIFHSALHKSVRGSDANATLYWLARMLESGEDPLYVARRMVRMAAEDIGLADPAALQIALAAYQSSERIGMPECDVCIEFQVLFKVFVCGGI